MDIDIGVMIEFVGDGGDFCYKFYGLIEVFKFKCVVEFFIDEFLFG